MALSIDSINPKAYYNESFSVNNDITLRDHWLVTGLVTTHWSVPVMSQKHFWDILMNACYLLSYEVANSHVAKYIMHNYTYIIDGGKGARGLKPLPSF